MRVLVADDHAEVRTLIAEVLARAGYQVTAVADGCEAQEAAAEREYDLAILDWVMPGTDGATLCRRWREAEDERPRYLIVLTARSAAEGIVAGLEAGADVYLTKPVGPDEILSRVRAAERIIRSQRRLREDHQRVAALAFTDELTGLPNRRGVLHCLGEALVASSQDGSVLSILAIDVDGLKSINDSLGHAAGDEVLREFSRRVLGLLHSGDAVGRLGGDEFLVILPGVSEMEALALGARLCQVVRERPFAVKPSGLARIRISVGVAEAAPDADAEDLLSRADVALYWSKRDGGDLASTAPRRP